MNNERIQALAEFLSSDADRMSELFGMDVEKACEEINAEGYDFTAEELQAFAEEVERVSVSQKSGELSDDELEQVSGGLAMTLAWAWGVKHGMWHARTHTDCWFFR